MTTNSSFLRPRFALRPITLAALTAGCLVLITACGGGSADSSDDGTADDPAAESAAASEPAPEETPAEDTSLFNTLRWQTASEVDNFGFDVFRGDAEEGPFTKLNDDPIAGAGTVDEPQSYVFVDRTNDPTREYYYYVESISMTNVRERFTPVFKAKAKQPAEAESDE